MDGSENGALSRVTVLLFPGMAKWAMNTARSKILMMIEVMVCLLIRRWLGMVSCLSCFEINALQMPSV
jgi:N-acyl-L-homoserine lactone synthetase